MREGPPREKQWVSWFYVMIWTLIIYVTIPLARTIQKFVNQHWSRELFTYAVLAAIIIALLAAVHHVIRHQTDSRGSYFWLLAVAAIFVGYTIELGKKSPEEAIHFVQYGVLGFWVYRALTHRLKDFSIYFAAAIICGIIGIIDEFIQWLTPQRLWGLLDIWMNFFSASMVLIAIAKGLKPKFIASVPIRANLRLLCRLLLLATILLGICLMNTPPRIAWYAEKIPWFAFLKENESMMLEYGYLYEDPEIGMFRSRLSPAALKQTDLQRAVKAAEILNRFQDMSKYREFLKIFTPVTDPFVHEARVHLFCRDANFIRSKRNESDSEKYTKQLTEAFRENEIMEKYFPNTLRHSAYACSPKLLALANRHLLRNKVFNSWVSRELVTRVSEAQVFGFFIVLIISLMLIHWYLGKSK